MKVREFKQWLIEEKVSDDAVIVLTHPGGCDDFEPESYVENDDGSKAVIAAGTG